MVKVTLEDGTVVEAPEATHEEKLRQKAIYDEELAAIDRQIVCYEECIQMEKDRKEDIKAKKLALGV
jgi:hypothetical protein